MSQHPYGATLYFSVLNPIASKKNGRRMVKRGHRKILVDGKAATVSSNEIRRAAREAIKAGGPVFDADDLLNITYRHNLRTGEVDVSVRKVGDISSVGNAGLERDVHGMLETLADAMQGIVFPNDKQVDGGMFYRHRPAPLFQPPK